MTLARTLLVTLPLALGGAGAVVHSTIRVDALERQLSALASESQAAGASFVETLQGEHVERALAVHDRRRVLALELAAARRNRLLGVLAVGAAALLGAALSVMSRIAADIEEDRRHVGS